LNNINKNALDEIKALATPPATIIDVCAIAFYLQPKSVGQPDWNNIKVSVLSNTKLVDDLKNYDVEKTKSGDAT